VSKHGLSMYQVEYVRGLSMYQVVYVCRLPIDQVVYTLKNEIFDKELQQK
jgi:hypothetical protein